jgi:drug/metabolite transporter (DMT)-like permease
MLAQLLWCLIWFSSGSLANILTKIIAIDSNVTTVGALTPLLDVLALKLVATVLIGLAHMRLSGDRSSFLDVVLSVKSKQAALTKIGLFQALTAYCADASYFSLGASLVQTLRGAESIFAVVLASILGLERFSAISTTACIIVCVGMFFCLGESGAAIIAPGLPLAIFAAFMEPTRAELTKRCALENGGSSSSFVIVSAGLVALTVVAPLWVVKLIFLGPSLPVAQGIILGLLYAIFNVASQSFLALTDTFTFSVVVTMSRATTLFMSIYFFHDLLSSTSLMGLVLVLSGLTLLAMSKLKDTGVISEYKKWLAIIGITVLLLTGLFVLKGRINAGHWKRDVIGTHIAVPRGGIITAASGVGGAGGAVALPGAGPGSAIPNLPPAPPDPVQGKSATTLSEQEKRRLEEEMQEQQQKMLQQQQQQAPRVVPTLPDNIPMEPLGSDFKSFPCAEGLFSMWPFPGPMPEVAVNALKSFLIRDGPNIRQLTFFCASSACLRQWAELEASMPHLDLEVKRIALQQTARGSPLELFVIHQGYYKLIMGDGFLKETQLVSILAQLLSKGGCYFDLGVLVSGKMPLLKQDFAAGFIFMSKTKSVLAAHLPRNAVFGTRLAENLMASYPVAPMGVQFVNGSWINVGGLHVALSMDFVDCDKCADVRVKVISQVDTLPFVPQVHFGTISYQVGHFVRDITRSNSGDEMQSYGGLQFYPFLDHFVERSSIGSFKSPLGKVTMFANAWFGGKNMQWPPASSLNPLLFSMHFAPEDRAKLVTRESLEYLKLYGAVGARDTNTLSFFKSRGIKSYFSACATLLIQAIPPTTSHNKIIAVDVDPKQLKIIVPAEYQRDVINFEQDIKYNPNNRQLLYRYQYAYGLLHMYANARLVITGRIHAALPCVALGIPVLFLNLPDSRLPGGGGGRSQGLTQLFHLVEYTRAGLPIEVKNFDWAKPLPNPNNAQRDRFRATFWNTIRKHESLRDMALMMGVVPFQLAPDSFRGSRLRFHLFHTGKEADWSLLARRTVESIFYRMPHADVWVHSSHLAPESLEIFKETGYSVHLVPMDFQKLLGDLTVSNKRISTTLVDNFLASPAFAEDWGKGALKLYEMLVLLIHGGSTLQLGDILLRELPEADRAVARPAAFTRSLDGAIFLKFGPDNGFLEDSIIAALTEFGKGSLHASVSAETEQCLTRQVSCKAQVLPTPTILELDAATCFTVKNDPVLKDALILRVAGLEARIGPPATLDSTCDKVLNQLCLFCNDLF